MEERQEVELPDTPRFHILRPIGRGGMGIVYEAFDRERNGKVALKTLRGRHDAQAMLKLKDEFRALQDIHHPNLIQLGELFQEGGHWFFTMELVQGVPFIEWVRPGSRDSNEEEPELTQSTPPLSFAGTAPIAQVPASVVPACNDARLRAALTQLVAGLNVLHRARKLHRDIKPSNVLVTPEGRVVILDLGGVADLERDPLAADQVIATAAYMAPEQLDGKIGPAVDWYSVGVMIYQALTGRLPSPQRSRNAQRSASAMGRPSAWVPGIDPMLEKLCEDLLQPEPSLRPLGEEILRRLGADEVSASAPPAPSLLGRQSELQALEAAFAWTCTGVPAIVWVTGESGVGKTALVQHFCEQLAQREGAVVLAGRCYERESLPFKAVDGAIDALSRYLARLPPEQTAALMPLRTALLGQVFPVLRTVDAVAHAPHPFQEPTEPTELRARAFVALRELFQRLRERRPTVLALDDLQWADEDSVALLAELFRTPEAPAVLLIGIARSSKTQGALQKLTATAGAGAVTTMELGALSSEDACSLATALAGDPARAAKIAEDANGHPLFIAELARGRFESSGKHPPSLQEALRLRIAELNPTAREVLTLIAVAGAPLSWVSVGSAAQLQPGQLVGPVQELRSLFLARTDGVHGSGSVETYHDRVREAVLGPLSGEERRDLHRRLALALEASSPKSSEVLAMHWRDAEEPQRAAQHAMLAAAAAAKGLAFDRAADLYAMSIDLGRPQGDELLFREIRRAEALVNAGRGVIAGQAFITAADHAPEGQRVELLRRAADQFLRSGNIDEGLGVIRRVLVQVGLRFPATQNRALLGYLTERARVRLRGLGFERRNPSTVDPLLLQQVDVCGSISDGLFFVDPVLAACFQSRGLRLALKSGDPGRVARALAREATFDADQGPSARARASRNLAAARVLADEVQRPDAQAMVMAAEGIVAYLEGRWREARELLATAQETLRVRCTGVTWELDTVQIWELMCLLLLGESRELGRLLPLYLHQAEERGDLYATAHLRMGFVSLARLADDDVEGARRETAAGLRGWSNHKYFVQHFLKMHSLAEIELYAENGEEAGRLVESGWKELEASLILRTQQARVTAVHLRARCALANSNLRLARKLSSQLLKENLPYADACAQMIRAALATRQGGRSKALDQWSEANSACARADLGIHLQCARMRYAELLGGEAGRLQATAAQEALLARGIVNPRRLVAMVAPL